MTFRRLTEIALPGPLPGAGPAWIGDAIAIPVEGGTAIARPEPEARVDLVPQAEVPAPDPWAVDPNGKRRFAALPEGSIVAQRRCRRCSAGWKRCWKLNVAGTTPATPLVEDGRVFFGSLDNTIYCVKARNGHRVWSADLQARVSRQLVLWQPVEDRAAEGEPETPPLILVVPDDGSELVALSGKTGSEVATLRIAAGEGKLVGVPVVTPDGHVAVARQKYRATDASLIVFEVARLGAEQAAESSAHQQQHLTGLDLLRVVAAHPQNLGLLR